MSRITDVGIILFELSQSLEQSGVCNISLLEQFLDSVSALEGIGAIIGLLMNDINKAIDNGKYTQADLDRWSDILDHKDDISLLMDTKKAARIFGIDL